MGQPSFRFGRTEVTRSSGAQKTPRRRSVEEFEEESLYVGHGSRTIRPAQPHPHTASYVRSRGSLKESKIRSEMASSWRGFDALCLRFQSAVGHIRQKRIARSCWGSNLM